MTTALPALKDLDDFGIEVPMRPAEHGCQRRCRSASATTNPNMHTDAPFRFSRGSRT